MSLLPHRSIQFQKKSLTTIHQIGLSGGDYFFNCVAEQGVEPCLGDYEPPVRLYTTPRLFKLSHYTSFIKKEQTDRLRIICKEQQSLLYLKGMIQIMNYVWNAHALLRGCVVVL